MLQLNYNLFEIGACCSLILTCLKLGMLQQNSHLSEPGHASAEPSPVSKGACCSSILGMLQQYPHLFETGHAAAEPTPV
jgi:hypothetical protein